MLPVAATTAVMVGDDDDGDSGKKYFGGWLGELGQQQAMVRFLPILGGGGRLLMLLLLFQCLKREANQVCLTSVHVW